MAAHLQRALPYLAPVISIAPILVFVHDHGYQLMTVTGPSMYPLLNASYNTTLQKDLVLVSMRRPWENLHRGQVVAMWTPHNPEKMSVKRVTALEGDKVNPRAPYPLREETVPVGHVWVEGEHPDPRFSLDSNTFGPVSKALVLGQVRAVAWPWRRARWLRWEDWRGEKKGRVEGMV